MLNDGSWPAGYGRAVLDTVDSTLDEARRCAASMPGPGWILALQQTAARGRRGRVWAMPAGNFAATLLMRPPERPGQAGLRSFVAALAVYDAVHAVTGRAEGLALKWPNDVLLNGGKLAGILLEAVGQGAALDHLAIGIGVNLVAAPGAREVEEGALRPVSLLSETGISVQPEEFLDALAPAYARYETQFTTYGFEPIRAAWLARAAKRGEIITARLAQTEHSGRFTDLDADGQLVLDTAQGRIAIPAGDVFF